MKKFIILLIVLISFYNLIAEEADMFGDTSEPITNEDKLEENEGKETNAAPAETKPAKGESKFQKFVNRSGKKALAGVKMGPEFFHNEFNGLPVGYHFDAFFEYNFIKNFGLQAELNLYSGYGGWFTFPIIAQGNIPFNDMFWLNAGAGLYISAGYFRAFDMGLIIKSALEINTKIGVFVADIRYSPGLYSTYYSKFHGTIAILVGYAVPLPF
jgi:hypothetical protein